MTQRMSSSGWEERGTSATGGSGAGSGRAGGSGSATTAHSGKRGKFNRLQSVNLALLVDCIDFKILYEMQKILPKKTDFIDFEHLYEQQKILPKNRFHQLKESIVVAENIAKKRFH